MKYYISYIYFQNKIDLSKYFPNDCEINYIYSDGIINLNEIELILKSNAIIIDNDVYEANIPLIIEKLKLYSQFSLYDNKLLITDICSIKSSNTHFEKNGRVASNEISIGELEVEKVARNAYEYALENNLDIVNIDIASTLISSKIWRKIVLDINEDYKNVYIKTTSPIDYALSFNMNKKEILLIHSICLNQIIEFLTSSNINYLGTIYLKDTTQALCSLPKKNIESILNELSKIIFSK